MNDIEARTRYDREYEKFKEQVREKGKSPATVACDYVVQDEILLKWIYNAGRQAADLAKKTLQDSVGMSVVGFKAAFKETKYWILVYVIIQIIGIFIYLVTSSNT